MQLLTRRAAGIECQSTHLGALKNKSPGPAEGRVLTGQGCGGACETCWPQLEV